METIGKYRIEEKIGSGGFGEVFKAYDPLIKRHVAIKTCGSNDEEVASRFFQEAEIGGNLHHRNITTVYDFGVHDGLPYLIQEYLSGEDLDAKVKRRDYLPYTEKLLYLLQIGRGLGYAHSQGVIHRDVKPANVRVLEDGTTKIMDFGIAKLALQESGLTQTGMTLGTAAYLAPEQVRGDAVDVRTDVFSFGILAYELLTYERPFQGEQISTVLYNLLNHEPEPITAHWPGAPPELVALIDRCLRKDAALRFADGNEVVRELEKLKKRGRRQSVKAPIADQPSAGTPSAGTSATPVAPRPPAVTAAQAHRPEISTTLGDDTRGASGLEYQLPPDRQTVDATAGIARSATPDRRSRASGLAILGLLTAIAAAAGWWLGTRGQPPKVDEASELPATAGATSPGAPEVAEQKPLPSTDPDPDEPQADVNPQPVVVPPPPPPPVTGRLVLPRVRWTDRMTARVGTKTYPLHRQHIVELPPGAYRAVFDLAAGPLGGGQAEHIRRTVEIQVTAGQSASVKIPIPPPGALSVRPLPGRPQGQVSINGEILGPTPLSRIRRQPGTYRLEILPRTGEGEGLKEEVALKAGQETILSFDLNAATVAIRTKALPP